MTLIESTYFSKVITPQPEIRAAGSTQMIASASAAGFLSKIPNISK